MRSAFLILVIALFIRPLGGGVAAEVPGQADQAAIRAVIEAQLDAFQADDGARAFSYASPAIQGIFQNPERFMTMVKTGYRPVYRPRRVAFQEVQMIGGTPTQLVLLVGPDQEVVMAYYRMQKQADGSWRINGCTLSVAPAV